jgi:hypothetical protein
MISENGTTFSQVHDDIYMICVEIFFNQKKLVAVCIVLKITCSLNRWQKIEEKSLKAFISLHTKYAYM